MKKLILIIGTWILTVNALAQDDNRKTQNESRNNEAYCALLKDGKIMLLAEGKQVNSDVKLANGTIVKADGTVHKSDKTNIFLKNGDCIDQDGNIIPASKIESEKDKMKEENMERNK